MDSKIHRLTPFTSKRPDWLVVDDMLRACDIPKDSPRGRQAYASCMGHCTTVSRARRFFDDPVREWIADKERILKFT